MAAEEAKMKEMERVQELTDKVAKFETKLASGELSEDEIVRIGKMKEAFDAELTKVEEKKEAARVEFEKLEGERNKEKELKKAKQAKDAKEAEFNEQLENQKKLAKKLKTQAEEIKTMENTLASMSDGEDKDAFLATLNTKKQENATSIEAEEKAKKKMQTVLDEKKKVAEETRRKKIAEAKEADLAEVTLDAT